MLINQSLITLAAMLRNPYCGEEFLADPENIKNLIELIRVNQEEQNIKFSMSIVILRLLLSSDKSIEMCLENFDGIDTVIKNILVASEMDTTL